MYLFEISVENQFQIKKYVLSMYNIKITILINK